MTFSEATTKALLASQGHFSVVRIETYNECCGDKFEFQAYSLTNNGMTLLVRRYDVQQGWGQDLEVEYFIRELEIGWS